MITSESSVHPMTSKWVVNGSKATFATITNEVSEMIWFYVLSDVRSRLSQNRYLHVNIEYPRVIICQRFSIRLFLQCNYVDPIALR